MHARTHVHIQFLRLRTCIGGIVVVGWLVVIKHDRKEKKTGGRASGWLVGRNFERATDKRVAGSSQQAVGVVLPLLHIHLHTYILTNLLVKSTSSVLVVDCVQREKIFSINLQSSRSRHSFLRNRDYRFRKKNFEKKEVNVILTVVVVVLPVYIHYSETSVNLGKLLYQARDIIVKETSLILRVT
uniref:Uncharacterized protein n=1 Tax=Glossina austeni TaxID=7395 RepID=A0A1A9VBK2_GLOAU